MKKFGEGQQPFHAIIDIPEGDSQELTTVTDQAMNSFYGEFFNLLTNNSLNPTATTASDLKQVTRAVYSSVSSGNFYIDNGSHNIKQLTHIKYDKFLYKYKQGQSDNGFIIEFINKQNNTTNVLINVVDVENNNFYFSNIPLVDSNNQELKENTLLQGSFVRAYFNASINKFMIITIGSMSDLYSENDSAGDKLIIVKQPFGGAIKTTQHDKNIENISVTDFGAFGDGVTDDTNAFKNAKSTGLPVYVPPNKNYRLSEFIDGNFWTNGNIQTTGNGGIFAKGMKSKTPLSIIIEKMYQGGVVNITCYGDSTTEGVGSSQHSNYRQDGQESSWKCPTAYPAQLERVLKDMFNNTNIRVNNAGYAGKTVYDGWATRNIYQKVKTAFSTDVLILGFGLNDIANGDFSNEKYVTEMKKIIGFCYANEIIPVVLTPNYSANEPWRTNSELRNTIIVAMDDFCRENNILCIDVNSELQRIFSASTKYENSFGAVARDTLHYNDYGYGLVAGYVAALLSKNTIFVENYSKITPEMGRIYRTSGVNTTMYWNSGLTAVGGNYVWSSSDLQLNDQLFEVWIYNTIPNAILRYHAISNDGCSTVDKMKIIAVEQANSNNKEYTHIASGTPYKHEFATTVENSQVLRKLNIGLHKVALRLNKEMPASENFVLAGYFSVSRQNQWFTTNFALMPGLPSPYVQGIVFNTDNDMRIGMGDNKDNIIIATGTLPKDTGFLILQNPAKYSNAEINNGRNELTEKPQEAILIFRDMYGNTKLYRAIYTSTIGLLWLTEKKNLADSYVSDEVKMLIKLKKDETNFNIDIEYKAGGKGILSYSEAHSKWDMPTGGLVGSVWRGIVDQSPVLINLNFSFQTEE